MYFPVGLAEADLERSRHRSYRNDTLSSNSGTSSYSEPNEAEALNHSSAFVSSSVSEDGVSNGSSDKTSGDSNDDAHVLMTAGADSRRPVVNDRYRRDVGATSKATYRNKENRDSVVAWVHCQRRI